MATPEIDVAELARLRAEGITLLDVRQPDEYDEYHVPGAVLIPLGEVADRLDEVPDDERVYVICKSGGRSAKAVDLLNGLGRDTVNVAGGSMAWVDAGYEVASGSAPG